MCVAPSAPAATAVAGRVDISASCQYLVVVVLRGTALCVALTSPAGTAVPVHVSPLEVFVYYSYYQAFARKLADYVKL